MKTYYFKHTYQQQGNFIMSTNTLQSNPSLSSNRDLKDFNPLKHFSQDNYKNNYPGCNDFLTEDSPHLYQVTKSELTSTLDNLLETLVTYNSQENVVEYLSNEGFNWPQKQKDHLEKGLFHLNNALIWQCGQSSNFSFKDVLELTTQFCIANNERGLSKSCFYEHFNVCNQVNLLQYSCGLIQTNNKCESIPVFNQLCSTNDDFSSYDTRELRRAIISAYRNDWDINTLQENHKNIIFSIDESVLNLLKQAMPSPEESSFNPAVNQDSDPQISIWCDPNIEPRYALYHSCRNRINDCLHDAYTHAIQLPPVNENAKDLCSILGVNDIVAIDGSGDHLGDNKACNESFGSTAFGLALHKAQSLVYDMTLFIDIDNGTSNEQERLPMVAEKYQDKNIQINADRRYGSYELFKQLNLLGVQFVIRTKTNFQPDIMSCVEIDASFDYRKSSFHNAHIISSSEYDPKTTSRPLPVSCNNIKVYHCSGSLHPSDTDGYFYMIEVPNPYSDDGDYALLSTNVDLNLDDPVKFLEKVMAVIASYNFRWGIEITFGYDKKCTSLEKVSKLDPPLAATVIAYSILSENIINLMARYFYYQQALNEQQGNEVIILEALPYSSRSLLLKDHCCRDFLCLFFDKANIKTCESLPLNQRLIRNIKACKKACISKENIKRSLQSPNRFSGEKVCELFKKEIELRNIDNNQLKEIDCIIKQEYALNADDLDCWANLHISNFKLAFECNYKAACKATSFLIRKTYIGVHELDCLRLKIINVAKEKLKNAQLPKRVVEYFQEVVELLDYSYKLAPAGTML